MSPRRFLLCCLLLPACGGTEKPPVDDFKTLPPADSSADVSNRPGPAPAPSTQK